MDEKVTIKKNLKEKGMEEKIRDYIQNAFASAPSSKSARDLQEEIIANLLDRYGDEVAAGKTEDEAYWSVLASVGDLDKLVDSLQEEPQPVSIPPEERKKSALLATIAVGLYIMSPFLWELGEEVFDSEVLAMLLFFGSITVATGLLVYRHLTRPLQQQANTTMVEEFQTWQRKSRDLKGFQRSVTSGLWLCTVLIYFIVSIEFGWAFSWLIFIAAAAVQCALQAIWQYQEGKHE